ncbi:MAG: sigma-70 family RNA polymerase sigma factor [Gemmatimonadaceae bacterium]|nr:sigma-70 family RNA polymerase sigma factor [Gemmatimonadaceae bacterium]
METGSQPAASPVREDFDREVLAWMDDVYRFAMSLTRDAGKAEDLVQETYLRAFRSWLTFQPGSDARRWLFTIARNAFLRNLERERHHVSLDDGDPDAMSAIQHYAGLASDGTDQLLARVDLAPALTEAIGQLNEPFRSAVVLVDVEGQSYEEAAAVLEVPIGTVRSRLFRGRRQLQEMLAEYARDAGFAGARAPQTGGDDA